MAVLLSKQGHPPAIRSINRQIHPEIKIKKYTSVELHSFTLR